MLIRRITGPLQGPQETRAGWVRRVDVADRYLAGASSSFAFTAASISL